MSALGFKTRVDPLACRLRHLHATESSDSVLVQYLLTSWLPPWQRTSILYLKQENVLVIPGGPFRRNLQDPQHCLDVALV